MRLHGNARTCLHSRRLIVERVKRVFAYSLKALAHVARVGVLFAAHIAGIGDGVILLEGNDAARSYQGEHLGEQRLLGSSGQIYQDQSRVDKVESVLLKPGF